MHAYALYEKIGTTTTIREVVSRRNRRDSLLVLVHANIICASYQAKLEEAN
jgi:hypothetical protein